MIITTQDTITKIANILEDFVLLKITKHLYIVRLYGSERLHPIGYHIPVLMIVKN